MAVQVQFADTAKIEQEIEKALIAKTNRAVQLVRNAAVRKVNVQQPTRRKNGRIRGLAPSKVGDPPKRVSGALAKSIIADVRREGDKIVGVVGTRLKYARRLELGFFGSDKRGRKVNHGPRPYLRPAFVELKERIKKLLGERVSLTNVDLRPLR